MRVGMRVWGNARIMGISHREEPGGAVARRAGFNAWRSTPRKPQTPEIALGSASYRPSHITGIAAMNAPARDIKPDPAQQPHAPASSRELLEIFMARRTRLVQMATRIIGCQCLAEDVVQETMLKICEGGLDPQVKSPAAYLFRMVRNLAIDCSRRRAREQRLDNPDQQGGGEFSASCPCPETIMARCQALRIVMAALQELPERTRHAFELHRLEGVSQRDIAERLKVSPTLVNFMVRDAHNHCRLKLLDHDMEGDIVPPPAGRAAQQGERSTPAATVASAAKPSRKRQVA